DGIRDFHVTGVQTCALPIFNGLTVYGASSLQEVINIMQDPCSATPVVTHAGEEFLRQQQEFEVDFTDVKGQANIKRALEIAAARSEERRVGKEWRTRLTSIQ